MYVTHHVPVARYDSLPFDAQQYLHLVSRIKFPPTAFLERVSFSMINDSYRTNHTVHLLCTPVFEDPLSDINPWHPTPHTRPAVSALPNHSAIPPFSTPSLAIRVTNGESAFVVPESGIQMRRRRVLYHTVMSVNSAPALLIRRCSAPRAQDPPRHASVRQNQLCNPVQVARKRTIFQSFPLPSLQHTPLTHTVPLPLSQPAPPSVPIIAP